MNGDNDLELNIELNADQAEAGTKKLQAFEKAWLHLASLPTIDFSQKFKVPNMSGQSSHMDSALGQSSTVEGHRAAVESLKKGQTRVKELSYTWDSLYKSELSFVKDKAKKKQFLSMMEKEAYKGMQDDTAVGAGRGIHPSQTHKAGGLVQHSKAVAQGSLGLAQYYKYKGDTDDLVLQGLGHDMRLKGRGGKFNRRHAQDMAGIFSQYGLSGPKDKDARTIANEADWLASRVYAGEYLAFDKKGKLKKTGSDWEGLRKRSITEGDAKATGLFGTGFLKITSEEEEKKAKSAKKYENSQHSALATTHKLFQVLKKIAMLGVAGLYIGIRETEFASNLVQGGASAFTGTTFGQTASNELREGKASLGKGSINAAVLRLSQQRGQFKLTGEGELLPMAMTRTIEDLMTGDRPMQEVYGEIVDMFIQQLSQAKTQGDKDKLLALVQTTLGTEAVRLVNTGAVLGSSWAGLGARMGADNDANGYGPGAIARNAEMQTSISGISDAWRDFFAGFMDIFGNPFLSWLAELMQAMTRLRGAAAFFVDYGAKYGAEKRAGDAYNKLLGTTHGEGLGLLAKEYDAETNAAGRAYDESSRNYDLKWLWRANSSEMTMPQRIMRANRLLNLRGEASLPLDMPYAAFTTFIKSMQDKERKEAMDRAAGVYTGDYGLLSWANPTARNTAKVYSAFAQNFAGSSDMSGLLDKMSRLRGLTDVTRLPGNMDAFLTQSMEMYNTAPTAANKALLETIVNSFLEVQRINDTAEAAKDVSMAPNIQINNSFPGVTNAAEISKAVGTMPATVRNAYNDLYVERG